MKSKLKGNLGVIKAIDLFSKDGFLVSLPFGDVGDYDLIVDYNGKLLRIQCKTSETNDGKTVSFNTAVTSMFTRKRYTKEMVDYLFLYDMIEDRAFIVEPNEKTEVTIRYELPKNGQKANARLANDCDYSVVINHL